jgi:hypothetical protein
MLWPEFVALAPFKSPFTLPALNFVIALESGDFAENTYRESSLLQGSCILCLQLFDT